MPSTKVSAQCLKQLSDAAVTRLSGPAVFARGTTYAASGAIEILPDAPLEPGECAALQAVVHGTHPYQVRVWLDEEDGLDGECDCPHAQEDNFCKHQVALALTWRARLGGAAVVPDEAAARKVASAAKRAQTQAKNRAALQQFLQAQSAQDLAERLWAWAERDRDCMAELKTWAAVSQTAQDPKALRSTLAELLRDRRDFLDWRESAVYAQRARAVVPLLAPWKARDAATGRSLCEYALRCLYKVAAHADDSNGALGGLLQEIMELHAAMLHAAPPPAAWLDDWLELMAADPWGLWDEETVLQSAGPAVQRRYAERACADWAQWQNQAGTVARSASTSREAYRVHLQRYRLRERYLRAVRLENDPRSLLQAMAGSAENENEYDQIIQLCEAQGWQREALQWAEAGYKRFPEDGQLQKMLLHCYERDGWDEQALAMRRSQLEARPTPQAYQAVLAAAQRCGLDGQAYRAELFAWLERREQDKKAAEERRPDPWRKGGVVPINVSVRLGWLLAEGDLAAALALTQQRDAVCHIDVLQELARCLPPEHNGAAAQLLRRVFDTVMPSATSPYTQALDLVRDIVALQSAPESQAWLAWLRASYKAKRNFIAGLSVL